MDEALHRIENPEISVTSSSPPAIEISFRLALDEECIDKELALQNQFSESRKIPWLFQPQAKVSLFHQFLFSISYAKFS
jgi:hypothetical protein